MYNNPALGGGWLDSNECAENYNNALKTKNAFSNGLKKRPNNYCGDQIPNFTENDIFFELT